MISQLTIQAQNALRAYINYGNDKTITQRNENLLTELTKIQSKLRRVINIYNVLVNNGISSIQKSDLNNIFLELKKLRNEVDMSERNKIIIGLPSKIDQLNARLVANWEQKVKADYDSIIQLGSILDNIFNDNKFSMINAYYKNAILNIPEKQAYFDKYTVELSGFQNSIKHFKMDEDIENFLIKMSKREATLYDVNNEILEWISQNELTEKVKLTF